LRREEEARAPEFSALAAPGRSQGRPLWSGRVVAASVCVAAITAAGLWLETALHRPHAEPATPVASIAGWKPPTDFLLETPGRELLQTVPVIGALPEYAKAAAPHHKGVQVKKTVLP